MSKVQEFLAKEREKEAVASQPHLRPSSRKRGPDDGSGQAGCAGQQGWGCLSPQSSDVMKQARKVKCGTVEDFYRGLLQWDILEELYAELTGERAAYEECHADELPDVTVPDRFESVQQYLDVWTPLLLQEIRAQILSGLMTESPGDPSPAVLMQLDSGGSFLGGGGGGWRRDRGGRMRQQTSASRAAASVAAAAAAGATNFMNVRPQFEEMSEAAVSAGAAGESSRGDRGSNGGGGRAAFAGNSLVLVMAAPDALSTTLALRGGGAVSARSRIGRGAASRGSGAAALDFAEKVPKAVLAVCTSASHSSEGVVLRLHRGKAARRLPADQRVYLLPLSTLSTVLREYDALNSLDRVALLPRILAGQGSREATALARGGAETVAPPLGAEAARSARNVRRAVVKPEEEEVGILVKREARAVAMKREEPDAPMAFRQWQAVTGHLAVASNRGDGADGSSNGDSSSSSGSSSVGIAGERSGDWRHDGEPAAAVAAADPLTEWEESGSLGKAFLDWMHGRFNQSQVEAIAAAATGEGLTLIKGPPGTGKTTTLKAILNAIHQKQYNWYYEAMLNVARAEPGVDTEVAWQNLAAKKPHILVAAPSNVAVDNIILRIMEEGFLDGNATRYNPAIARIGRGSSPDVRVVSVEDQVNAIVGQSQDSMRARLQELDARMQVLRQIVHLQRHRVRALALATPYPMPAGWEVRVNEEGRAYYVDHEHRATQWTPPPPPPMPAAAAAAAASAEAGTGGGAEAITALQAAAAEAAAAADATAAEAAGAVPLESMKEHQEAAAEMLGALEEYERQALEFKRYRFAMQAKNVVHDINLRQQLEVVFLDTAHIVFTTLSSSGLPCMDSAIKFEAVVVDEAAQSVEPSTLIPLRLGSRHCVLVGDPQQLSATVFSQGGKSTQYDRSLFQRLEACGHPVHMLNTQYRMHPRISAFPRAAFYDNKLLDGANVLQASYNKPYHRYCAFQPFVFLDLHSGAEEKGMTSLRNVGEAVLAVNIYTTLQRLCEAEQREQQEQQALQAQQDPQQPLPPPPPLLPPPPRQVPGIKGQVGIITPYSQQVHELQEQFRRALGPGFRDEVEISTVDGFQGREKDVIIVSCVRASGSAGIGFLADVRRMNVALTRAKYGLYVIGRESTLRINRQWASLIQVAREADALLRIADPATDLLGLGKWSGTDGGGTSGGTGAGIVAAASGPVARNGASAEGAARDDECEEGEVLSES